MGRDHLEDTAVDRSQGSRGEIVDWMHLAQERDQWRALVYTVMNIRVP
jgi:hypothetical protein